MRNPFYTSREHSVVAQMERDGHSGKTKCGGFVAVLFLLNR